MVCDKCGKDVPKDNNAIYVALEVGEISKAALICLKDRHFLSTNDCEGSPSRNKDPIYLEAHKKLLKNN